MNGTATVALKGNSLFQFCNWKAEGLYLSRICYRVDSVKQKVDDIFQPRKNRFLIHFVKGSSLKEVLDKDRQLLQGHLKLVLIKLQHWKVFSTFFRGEVGENGMRVLQMLNTTCVMMNQQTRGLSKMPEAVGADISL
ncbi:hypothetical protein DKX38_022227 [Salix brachista]|uniref:Uncharacterized protein n=1 Tax=Salix brachista TaxID=2182728 RepID=A0A5N5JZ25_9ROSI|nr:hypothetical protein DKX38_022227 [Salix brachista]